MLEELRLLARPGLATTALDTPTCSNASSVAQQSRSLRLMNPHPRENGSTTSLRMPRSSLSDAPTTSMPTGAPPKRSNTTLEEARSRVLSPAGSGSRVFPFSRQARRARSQRLLTSDKSRYAKFAIMRSCAAQRSLTDGQGVGASMRWSIVIIKASLGSRSGCKVPGSVGRCVGSC
jgi:hypothetical protein